MKSEVKLGEKDIGRGNPIFIISEVGSNHNRDLEKARGLVQIAAEAGADAVKFQTFVAERLVAKSESLPDGTNLCELFGRYELPHEWHKELFDYAHSLDIEFLSSPFDFESVDLLDELGVPAFKIASGDLEVVLMHCVSSYPSPPEAMNLRAIDTLRRAFKLPVGLSDHTLGVQIPIAAAALGIDLLEKHFTDQRQQQGLDHSYSMEPVELKEMIDAVRTIEKSLGSGEKVCARVESDTQYYARRSIFARRQIPKDKKIERDDIKLVRPQRGIDPEHLDVVLGRAALKTIEEDEPITWDCV